MFRRSLGDATCKIAAVILCAATVLGATPALAAYNSTFSQAINPGTLATDIRDASRVTVASPSVSMSAVATSFDCHAGGTASTGTFGSDTQRIYVDNPNAANGGWTLTIAATNGPTALWSNGGATNKFDFNDASGTPAGCADSADADSYSGQMTINPSAGTLTADSLANSTANISTNSSASFSEGTLNSITLLTAAAASVDIGRWYLTGVGVSQTIPAEQPADSYTINLTLTVTAS